MRNAEHFMDADDLVIAPARLLTIDRVFVAGEERPVLAAAMNLCLQLWNIQHGLERKLLPERCP